MPFLANGAVLLGNREHSSCQPRSGNATLLAWGPQPPLSTSVTPLAAVATIGGCVHSPHGKACCKAACPSRQGLNENGEPGFATSMVWLSRRSAADGGEGARPRSPRRSPRMTSASQSGAVPIGDRTARIPRRAFVRAPAIPHQLGRSPEPSHERSNGCRRACACSRDCLGLAAPEGVMPVLATWVGASETLHRLGNWRRGEAAMCLVCEKDAGGYQWWIMWPRSGNQATSTRKHRKTPRT